MPSTAHFRERVGTFSPDLRTAQMTLCGWGRYPCGTARVVRPEKISELKQVLGSLPGTPLIARGLGRSYGDAAVNDGGLVVNLTRLNRMISFDPGTGRLRCEAGVSFADLLRTFVPRGFFPPVTPGTQYVTLGGAIASDVHGKNHHRQGSFSAHVESFSLLTASGETLTCSRTQNCELFWATFGGMGLTGIVIDLELKLRKIETAYIRQETRAFADTKAALEALDGLENDYEFAIVWVDCASREPNFGRAIATFGNFATKDEMRQAGIKDPLGLNWRKKTISVPFITPLSFISRASVRAFNALHYLLNSRRTQSALVDLENFLYPLDKIHYWNRLYGPKGMVQYHCVVPAVHGHEAVLEILRKVKSSEAFSSLAVIKKFGAQEGLLAFPRPGYSIAMDFSVTPASLKLLVDIDRIVLHYGGRVYLAKDARMMPETFRQMYPELPSWLEIKRRVDPEGLFSSQLSRRLGIDGASAQQTGPN